jgi:hypothetical protein
MPDQEGTMSLPIIIVLNDPPRADALADALAPGAAQVITCHDIASACTVLRRHPPRALVTEICLQSLATRRLPPLTSSQASVSAAASPADWR